ncbi:PP2C family protein-serine/threonine phosphatase [Planctomycetota bacterium]
MMKILIAEDERITRRKLQRQLEQWGHEVTAAEDGQQAWEQFQQQKFDILVTDWDMPEMNGYQLVEKIRGGEQSHYVYLIMLTGRSETDDLVAGMEAGADDFVSKPFDKNELRVRLRAGERIIELERELARQNTQLTSANDKMKQDLRAAAKVQQELLPKELPDTPLANFAWHYQPCDELGGDILNMFMLDEHHVGMYLLDVSGHGVPAALLSVSLSRVLTTREIKSSVLVTSDPQTGGLCVNAPADVAERLNRQFPSESQDFYYFTMGYAVLDTRTQILRYVLAGHPGPILVRPGQTPEMVEGTGLPVGIVEDAVYDEYELQLQPGDRLCFYSDGITEASNKQDKMLDTEGLIELIAQTSTGTVQESLDACVAALRSWCEPCPFQDDVSFLVLEIPT